MNYRRFSLVNSKGQIWDLTDLDLKASFCDPEGLGYVNEFETIRYGDRLVVKNSAEQFPSINGDVVFYDSLNQSRYDLYNQFVSFVSEKPLKLYYSIPGELIRTYHIECLVSHLKKTESKNGKTLVCNISLQGLSMWYGDEIRISGTNNAYLINNDGHFPVGFEITIEGGLTDPYVTLSQDGELYGEAKFDSSTAFNSVYVNSNDGEQNVILEQGGAVIPNPLSYQDLSISNGSIYVTFVKLARGESELSIGMESGTVSSVKIEFTPKYRSV